MPFTATYQGSENLCLWYKRIIIPIIITRYAKFKNKGHESQLMSHTVYLAFENEKEVKRYTQDGGADIYHKFWTIKNIEQYSSLGYFPHF